MAKRKPDPQVVHGTARSRLHQFGKVLVYFAVISAGVAGLVLSYGPYPNQTTPQVPNTRPKSTQVTPPEPQPAKVPAQAAEASRGWWSGEGFDSRCHVHAYFHFTEDDRANFLEGFVRTNFPSGYNFVTWFGQGTEGGPNFQYTLSAGKVTYQFRQFLNLELRSEHFGLEALKREPGSPIAPELTLHIEGTRLTGILYTKTADQRVPYCKFKAQRCKDQRKPSIACNKERELFTEKRLQLLKSIYLTNEDTVQFILQTGAWDLYCRASEEQKGYDRINNSTTETLKALSRLLFDADEFKRSSQAKKKEIGHTLRSVLASVAGDRELLSDIRVFVTRLQRVEFASAARTLDKLRIILGAAEYAKETGEPAAARKKYAALLTAGGGAGTAAEVEQSLAKGEKNQVAPVKAWVEKEWKKTAGTRAKQKYGDRMLKVDDLNEILTILDPLLRDGSNEEVRPWKHLGDHIVARKIVLAMTQTRDWKAMTPEGKLKLVGCAMRAGGLWDKTAGVDALAAELSIKSTDKLFTSFGIPERLTISKRSDEAKEPRIWNIID